jgi:hypothetical protein
MMSDLRKAAEMALEEFELFFNTYPYMEKGYTLDARKALRQALAQPEQEWVGLTDEESKPLIQKAMMYYGHNPDHWTLTAGAGFCILARAIESKLKEKNCG